MWRHSICVECWNEKNPDRQAHRLVEAEENKCCFCGKQHSSGIFVRADPNETPCKGQHD